MFWLYEMMSDHYKLDTVSQWHILCDANYECDANHIFLRLANPCLIALLYEITPSSSMK